METTPRKTSPAPVFSALAARGIAVAATPREACRLAHAAELGEVREIHPRALPEWGTDVWRLSRGRVSLTCRGSVTSVLFDRDELRRLVSVVARRLEVRA